MTDARSEPSSGGSPGCQADWPILATPQAARVAASERHHHPGFGQVQGHGGAAVDFGERVRLRVDSPAPHDTSPRGE